MKKNLTKQQPHGSFKLICVSLCRGINVNVPLNHSYIYMYIHMPTYMHTLQILHLLQAGVSCYTCVLMHVRPLQSLVLSLIIKGESFGSGLRGFDCSEEYTWAAPVRVRGIEGAAGLVTAINMQCRLNVRAPQWKNRGYIWSFIRHQRSWNPSLKIGRRPFHDLVLVSTGSPSEHWVINDFMFSCKKLKGRGL